MPADRRPKTASKTALTEVAAEPSRRPGRPPKAIKKARRQNPNLKMTTVYLDKKAYADAQAMLLRSNAEKNEEVTVSDILSGALVKWVSEQ